MISSIYDLLFDEILRSGAIQVPAAEINTKSMTSQFYKYRDRMQFATFLHNKSLQFYLIPDHPSGEDWYNVTMCQSKRKTAIKFTSVPYDNTSLPTSVGTDQSG
jgi:hypothetical protein